MWCDLSCVRGMPHCLLHASTLPQVRYGATHRSGCQVHRSALRAPHLKTHRLLPQGPRMGKQCTKACLQTAATRQPTRLQKSCTFDVIVLGNLCLDIFVSVPELPSKEDKSRRQLLHDLTLAPPDRSSWEVGGNTNFMIAAARLGMQVAPVGHLGPDEYGQFIKDVLQVCQCTGHACTNKGHSLLHPSFSKSSQCICRKKAYMRSDP